MGTVFRHKHILARSFTTASANEISIGDCDVLVVAASWDSRCKWISKVDAVKGKLGIMITYDEADPYGRQKKNREVLLSYLRSRCSNTEEVKGSSQKIEDLWSALRDKVLNVASGSSSPLSICFDITAAPRFCSLASLASFMNKGIAREMNFLYADGIYGNPDATNTHVFHEGGWKSIPISSLEQMYEPAKKKCIIVSVGFEGTRTMRVVNEQEPDRIAVLLPDPGVHPDYVKITERENEELFSEYLVPPEKIVRADAGDAVQAWESLHKAQLERRGEENIFYVCCGTKPHALALGLRALTTQLGTVLYYVPDNHTVTDVKPAGRYRCYNIRDTSALIRVS